MTVWLGRLLLLLALPAGFVAGMLIIGAEGGDQPVVDSAGTLTSLSLEGDFDDELTDPASDSARYVILREDLASGIPDIAAIRKANPDAQILVAKNAAFTLWDESGDGTDRAGEPRCPFAPYQGSGVDYCVANSREDWFLHSAADPETRLQSSDFATQWAMNPANREYRQEWAGSVLERLRDVDRDGITDEGINDRYDGVWIDDVNVRPGHGLAERGIADMPAADPDIPRGDVPAYREGMVGFIDYASNQIRDAPERFVTMVNVDQDIYDPLQRPAALQIAGDVDVYNQERFFRFYFEDAAGMVTGDALFSDPGTAAAPDWTDWIDWMAAIQKTGASYAGITYGRDDGPRDQTSQVYVRASFLIGWDGTDGGALVYRSFDDTRGGPLGLSAWTASVGEPQGDAEQIGAAHRRDFSDGVVLIDPSLTEGATVDLGEAYALPDGSCPAAVGLEPGDALILPSCPQR